MIDLLRKLLDLVLRFLDWRRDTKRARERNKVRKAVAEHDAELMNEILQKMRDER